MRQSSIIEDLHRAMCMLGLNPTEQEVVDIPNEIARLEIGLYLNLYLLYDTYIQEGFDLFP